MKNTNRARLMTPCVVAGFPAGFIGGACAGFLAGSIMFLQGNIVKVFVKIKVLKSPGVRCQCTYMVSPCPGNTYKLRGGGRGGDSVSGARAAVFGRAPPHPLASTCIHYRLHCCCISVPTKETMQVYSHLGTHATPTVKSSKSKIVTVTYECSEPSSEVLPWTAVYVTCLSTVSTSTTASLQEPLEIKHKKL